MKTITRTIAGAAAAVLGATLLSAAPASAAGGRCDGQQVKTCVSIGLDGADFRARASVRDMPGSGDFSVRVTNIQLQQKVGGRWVTELRNKDHDGWHATKDTGRTRFAYCPGTGEVTVRARAHFSWKRVGQEGEWMNSKPVTVPCVIEASAPADRQPLDPTLE